MPRSLRCRAPSSTTCSRLSPTTAALIERTRVTFGPNRTWPLARLAADSGARRGELAALKSADLDCRVLHIRRAESGGTITAPKSGRSLTLTLGVTMARLWHTLAADWTERHKPAPLGPWHSSATATPPPRCASTPAPSPAPIPMLPTRSTTTSTACPSPTTTMCRHFLAADRPALGIDQASSSSRWRVLRWDRTPAAQALRGLRRTDRRRGVDPTWIHLQGAATGRLVQTAGAGQRMRARTRSG